jgi:hypothetical protein
VEVDPIVQLARGDVLAWHRKDGSRGGADVALAPFSEILRPRPSVEVGRGRVYA